MEYPLPKMTIRQFVTIDLPKAGIHPNSHRALERFLTVENDLTRPQLPSKVAWYDELESIGLKNSSPLFIHLFKTLAKDLPLKTPTNK